jgi:hypothetical protein
MISPVDETGGPALVTGYEFVQDAEPGLGRGGRFKSVQDAGAVAVGLAHAVESGKERSVCGRTMQMITGPWPPVIGSRCPECREALT